MPVTSVYVASPAIACVCVVITLSTIVAEPLTGFACQKLFVCTPRQTSVMQLRSIAA